MARTRKMQTKVCSVTGLETSVNNFYKNQTHVVVQLLFNFRKQIDMSIGEVAYVTVTVSVSLR